MIKVGYRISLGTDDPSEGSPSYYSFTKKNSVVEWALPHKFNDYMEQLSNGMLDKLSKFIKSSSFITPLSLHAPAGRISGNDSIYWLLQVMTIANFLDIPWVVVHPNNMIDLLAEKQLAHSNISLLNNIGSKVRFAIEAFKGRNRVFTIEDIMSYGLPMVLDTSHVPSYEYAAQLLHRYSSNIPIMHLSAKIGEEQHQRVNDDCLGVLKAAVAAGWSGTIILEYMPEYYRYVEEDCDLVVNYLNTL